MIIILNLKDSFLNPFLILVLTLYFLSLSLTLFLSPFPLPLFSLTFSLSLLLHPHTCMYTCVHSQTPPTYKHIHTLYTLLMLMVHLCSFVFLEAGSNFVVLTGSWVIHASAMFFVMITMNTPSEIIIQVSYLFCRWPW